MPSGRDASYDANLLRQRPQSRPSSWRTHTVAPAAPTHHHLFSTLPFRTSKALLCLSGWMSGPTLSADQYREKGLGASSWHPPGSSARIIVCHNLPSPGSWGYNRPPHLLRGCTRPHQMVVPARVRTRAGRDLLTVSQAPRPLGHLSPLLLVIKNITVGYPHPLQILIS